MSSCSSPPPTPALPPRSWLPSRNPALKERIREEAQLHFTLALSMTDETRPPSHSPEVLSQPWNRPSLLLGTAPLAPPGFRRPSFSRHPDGVPLSAPLSLLLAPPRTPPPPWSMFGLHFLVVEW